jgi:peptide/nickel transport system permease protein
MFVIGITGWPGIARLIRGEVLKQRALEYTSAARALGVSRTRIIFRHILPNSLAPALVAIPFGIAGAIVTEAGLSLLGFGVRPPTATWGSVLQGGYGNYAYSWMIIYPSLVMFLTLTAFNLVGSGMRDAMDPRLRV